MKPLENTGTNLFPAHGISHSSKTQFFKDRAEWVRARVFRVGKIQQTWQMATGNAFDAIIKWHIDEIVNGPRSKDTEPCFKGVEVEKDRCVALGWEAYNWYLTTSEYRRLRNMITSADSVSVIDDLTKEVDFGTGPILMTGKPDLSLRHGSCHSILDYKLATGEKLTLTGGYVGGRGVIVGHDPKVGEYSLEGVGKEYGEQVYLYGRLMNDSCDGTTFGIIEKVGPWAKRVVRYAGVLNGVDEVVDTQICVMAQALRTGHVFFELSREESDERMVKLEEECMKINNLGLEKDGEYLKSLLGRK